MTFPTIPTSLSRLIAAVLLNLSLYICASAFAAKPQTELAELEASFGGNLGVFALDTATGHTVAYRAETRFPIQSTFKAMLVAGILKKSMAESHLLDQKVTYKKEDLVSWSPITEKHLETGMTIRELCASAIMYSDNTATNLLMKQLGGSQALTAFARSIGDHTFQVSHWEPLLNSDFNNPEDTSTPKAMAESLQKLALGAVLTPAAREQFVTWMRGNTTGDTKIRAGVSQDWVVADKTGGGDYEKVRIANDIAILWPPTGKPIILAIYTNQDKKDTIQRDDIIAATTRIVLSALR